LQGLRRSAQRLLSDGVPPLRFASTSVHRRLSVCRGSGCFAQRLLLSDGVSAPALSFCGSVRFSVFVLLFLDRFLFYLGVVGSTCGSLILRNSKNPVVFALVIANLGYHCLLFGHGCMLFIGTLCVCFLGDCTGYLVYLL